MSPPDGDLIVPGSGFPGVSGDEPAAKMATATELVFSPRERG